MSSLPQVLPACLDQTWNIAIHRCFAQLVTAKTKFAINRVWTTSDLATALYTTRARIAWLLLQSNLCGPLLLVSRLWIYDQRLQLRAFRGIFCHGACAFL